VNFFDTIEELLGTDLPGWCDYAKAQALASTVLALRPRVTLEIGVFGGRSFLPMALAHKEFGGGVCIGIDPWLNHASKQGQVGKDEAYWAQLDHESVYQVFLTAMRQLSVESFCRIHRMTTDEFDPIPEVGMLHVDGNHGPQAESDIKRFSPMVVSGGFCCLDDLDWTGGAPRRGAEWMLQNGFEMLYRIGTGAMYRKL
jgi:hypothetical protein